MHVVPRMPRVLLSVRAARAANGLGDPRARGFGDERGAILVAVMLIMIVLLGLGMSGLFLTKSNLQMIANTNLRNQALYVAEAGLERARDILNGPVSPDLTSLLGGLGHVPNPADEIPNAINAATGRPIGRGAVLTDGSGVPLVKINYPTSISHGEPVPGNPNGLGTALMGAYTVYIRNDTAECRLGKFTVDGEEAHGNQAVVIRSEGTAMDGRTTVALEMTMGGGVAGGEAAGAGGIASVLCNAGKNACDDNNSVQNNVVVNN
jgi:hypothetical protein